MNIKNILPVICLFLFSCSNSGKKTAENESPVDKEQAGPPVKISFFPVTDYIKGQITEIKSKGVNPIKIIVKGTRLDSVWLKMEDLDKEFSAFLTPIIDSTNLSGLFTEKNFLDQTVNAFTFTYDPVKALPDSFSLQHWDVYVDPESGKVRRVYLLKRTPDHKALQLTWQSNKSCKMVYISKDPKGMESVEREISIKWDF